MDIVKDLIHGYFRHNFSLNAPNLILHKTKLFTFELEGFIPRKPENVIMGINKIFIKPLNKSNKRRKRRQRLKQIRNGNFPNKNKTIKVGMILGRNIIKQLECDRKYHWRIAFRSNSLTPSKVEIGIKNMTQNKEITVTLKFDHYQFDKVIDLYLMNNCVTFSNDHSTMTSASKFISNTNTSTHKLYINYHGFVGKVELLSYHDSKWYEKGTGFYGECIPDIGKKIKYFKKGLSRFYNKEWSDQLLFCYLRKKDYDLAYKHLIKYKNTEIECLTILTDYFFKIKEYKKALHCFEFIELKDKLLQKINKQIIAECYHKTNQFVKSLKYAWSHYHLCSKTDKMNLNLMAANYSKLNQHQNALKVLKVIEMTY